VGGRAPGAAQGAGPARADRAGRREAEQAERQYDLDKAAELRLGPLPDLQRRLEAEEERLAASKGGARLLREVVTADEIASIVSRWTGTRSAACKRGSGKRCSASTRSCTSGS
jgi:ATP-dependent Clp protease ATP-binding subunit ClpB